MRHKNGGFLYGVLRVSDMPLLRQGVAALNATPLGQWHITQVPGWFPSLAEGCTRIVLLPELPPRGKAAALSLKSIPRPGLTQLGFVFLVFGKLGCRHFLTLDAGMGFPPLVHPASSRFAGPEV